ncbi:MAG TPA: hypothetical protein PKK45_13725 [Leptospiraceae bacterium]|nr:hypothetical protein [Leptospiraceae bacterium]HNN59872.1 hypothetical protein [Leptospiraceae bacterium]
MRLKMQLENLTLMLLCVIALLSFFIGLMLFVRYSFNWLIFENVADSFYLRLLAYLGGAAGPLLIVNVLLNFLMYVQARVYQIANYTFPPLVVDNRTFFLRTVFGVSIVSVAFFIVLFIVHLVNLRQYENRFRDEIASSVKENATLLNAIIQNATTKQNPYALVQLSKPLLKSSAQVRIIVPITNELGKQTYRFLDEVFIPVEYDKQGNKLPAPTEFQAYGEFYQVNSSYFKFYAPTQAEERYFQDVASGKDSEPYLSRSGDHFRVIAGLRDPKTGISVFIWSDSAYFRKGQQQYFQF